MASPLKVLILNIPKCSPDAKVLIKHPTSALGSGVEEVVPVKPILCLAMWEQEVRMVVLGEPLEEVVPVEPILHVAVQEPEVGRVVLGKSTFPLLER